MKYCKRCVMPDTRPGILFDEEGICSACRSYEARASVDWDARWAKLVELCERHRGRNGTGYDCAIAVSGGKDSHFQVHLLKEELGMNPILFSVEDNFPMTEAGKHNLKNISEEFGCHVISIKPNIKAQKKIMRYTFERYGKPTWYVDRLIYTYPLMMALKFDTPLLVYGENVSHEYGGSHGEETPSAKDQLLNGVASDIDFDELVANAGVSMEDLELCKAPAAEEMDRLEPVYVSYFLPWNSFANYNFARSRGFHDLTHEWVRTHHVESFDQVDSRAYLVHSWLKYPKFGHASATDYASRMVRYGLISREEAVELVREHDAKLDPLCVRDFTEFLGMTESEFWSVVDKLYNPELFERDEVGDWRLREAVR